ncbi:MFS transporter [uncultured Schumannella sp.]|uniref:MFS transporter n=1 Tax=uncultured Schumannella sp. TaxID=1195956 RepID=UPI0025F0FBEA|nr:MFS transporter [uncultured Schumannella sp.]
MSQPTSPPPLTAIPSEAPGPKQGKWFLPTFVLAWFGVNLALGTIGGASIPKALAFLDDDSKDTNLAIIAAVGGVVVMIITPLFGRLSDRTRSRFGMRRPWMLIGVLIGLVGVIGLALAPNISVMVLSWAIVQIGFGATNMAQHALLADQVPTRIRARVAAATGVSAGIATIIGAAIVASLPNDQRATWFLIPGIIGAAFALVLMFGLRDRIRTAPSEPLSIRAILSTYWLNPLQYRDFAWAWVCRLFVTMSIVSVSLYLLFFIIDRLGIPKEEASGVQAQALLFFFVGNVVMTLIFGWVSDRTGRRKIIVFVACLVTCVGLSLAILAPDTPTFMLAIGIVGAGQGAFISVDVALMTEVLPNFENAGKDLGIVALAYQLPQLLVPIIAVPVLAIGGGGNYTALYIVAIVLSLLGGLAVLPITKVK